MASFRIRRVKHRGGCFAHSGLMEIEHEDSHECEH